MYEWLLNDDFDIVCLEDRFRFRCSLYEDALRLDAGELGASHVITWERTMWLHGVPQKYALIGAMLQTASSSRPVRNALQVNQPNDNHECPTAADSVMSTFN